MFTGLILGVGETMRVIAGSNEARFVFRPRFAAPEWVKGESIAVNGVCLTVESFDRSSFTAYASGETLAVTTLGELRPGRAVNLERALALGDRLGGHLVSGHVDGIATVESVASASSSLRIRVGFPEQFSGQVIPKGSIALDGVSLTVNDCGQGYLEVNIIPETQSATTIAEWTTGRALNFETDLIGKYVEHMLSPLKKTGAQSRLTLDFLRDNGF